MESLSELEREVYLVGLSGLPKESPRNVRLCDVVSHVRVGGTNSKQMVLTAPFVPAGTSQAHQNVSHQFFSRRRSHAAH